MTTTRTKTPCKSPLFIAVLMLFLNFTPLAHSTPSDELPSLGDQTSSTISLEQEYHLGRAWLRQLRAQVKLVDDPLIFDYLHHLLYKLASSSELAAPRLELVVIDDARINAFAAPGGVIGLNAGLLLNARSEAEVAAVIAHELAHLSQRHFARRTQHQQRNQWLHAAALLGSIALMATTGADAGMAALATTQAAAIDQMLRYSRSNEQEADRVGMRNLINAGYDPKAMPDFFHQLVKAQRYSGQRPPEFLLTHPVSESRIADAYNRVTDLKKQSVLSARQNDAESLEFQLMKARAEVDYSRENSKTIRLFQQRLKRNDANKEVSTYGLSYAYYKVANYKKALQYLEPLVKKRPESITYQFSQAQALAGLKRYTDAIKVLKQALAIAPDNIPLHALLASTYYYQRNYPRALSNYKKLQRSNPLDPAPWYMIAETQGKMKNALGAHEARSEYFFLSGNLPRALEQMRFALALTGQDTTKAARLKRRLKKMQNSADDLDL